MAMQHGASMKTAYLCRCWACHKYAYDHGVKHSRVPARVAPSADEVVALAEARAKREGDRLLRMAAQAYTWQTVCPVCGWVMAIREDGEEFCLNNHPKLPAVVEPRRGLAIVVAAYAVAYVVAVFAILLVAVHL